MPDSQYYHWLNLCRFPTFWIPTRSDSIHIGFFQLLCKSQLNFLGSIQTIIKADSTMDSTYPCAQPAQFTAASTELNSWFT